MLNRRKRRAPKPRVGFFYSTTSAVSLSLSLSRSIEERVEGARKSRSPIERETMARFLCFKTQRKEMKKTEKC